MIFNFSYFVLCCVIGYSILITFKNLFRRRLRIPSHEPSTRSTDFASPAIFRDLVDDVSDTLETREDESDTSETREDVSNTFEVSDVDVPVVSGHGFAMRGNVAGISRNRFYAGDSVSRHHADGAGFNIFYGSEDSGISNFGNGESAYVGIGNFGNTPSRPFWEPLLEFFKMSPPDLRGPRGATATQGGGQGAITQGGQGTSQQ